MAAPGYDPSTKAALEHVSNFLLAQKSLPVNSGWLQMFLVNYFAQNRTTPLPVVTQTVLFKVLVSDIQETLKDCGPDFVLPRTIANVNCYEMRVKGPVVVQVLDVQDIGSSTWSQVEKMEMIERGEMTRGRREVIRNLNRDESGEIIEGGANDGGRSGPPNNRPPRQGQARGAAAQDSDRPAGPHRLLLQDACGTLLSAMELLPIPSLNLDRSVNGNSDGSSNSNGMKIGMKLVLRDILVARGMALLEPRNVTVLGGKIEAKDKAWREGRKETLLRRLATGQAG